MGRRPTEAYLRCLSPRRKSSGGVEVELGFGSSDSVGEGRVLVVYPFTVGDLYQRIGLGFGLSLLKITADHILNGIAFH